MCFFIDIVLYECRAGLDLIKTIYFYRSKISKFSILFTLRLLYFFTKFIKTSTINKTCSTNHKNFPIKHDLAHLRHLAVKQTAKA